MNKLFHVNTATGDIGPCRAVQGNCPFGEENHYASLVGAAQAFEASMEKDLADRTVHWNPRTLQPADCYNAGCGAGIPRAEHFLSWDDAKRAQEPRWRALLKEGKLKGKELTSAIHFTEDPEILDHAATKGTMKQLETLLWKESRAVSVGNPPTLTSRARYMQAAQRGFYDRPDAALYHTLPFISGRDNTAFLREIGVSDDTITKQILANPNAFFHRYSYSNQYTPQEADADAAMVLSYFEAALDEETPDWETLRTVGFMDQGARYSHVNDSPLSPTAPEGPRFRRLQDRASVLKSVIANR